MWHRTDPTDALREMRCLARIASPQENLETAKRRPARERLIHDAIANVQVNAQVPFDARNRVNCNDFIGHRCFSGIDWAHRDRSLFTRIFARVREPRSSTTDAGVVRMNATRATAPEPLWAIRMRIRPFAADRQKATRGIAGCLGKLTGLVRTPTRTDIVYFVAECAQWTSQRV